MEARVALRKGTILDATYRIERVIGSGGFGITYEAEDVNLRSKVAIKEYYPLEFADRDATMSVRPRSERHKKSFTWGRESFLDEARTLAQFRHPSVVQVTRIFEAHSTAYMVMVFEEGLALEAWLIRLGRAPTQEEIDRITAPLLDALAMIHAAHFLHRDIAPDNVLVRADSTPVLLDFGAARRAVAERSRVLTGIVKAGYSPPEQYSTDSRLQGPWSDIYALGGTLYRAIAGTPPDESTLRISDDRLIPAARAARGAYRSGFLRAIDMSLRVKPAERPQSVAQLRPLLLGSESRPGEEAAAVRQMTEHILRPASFQARRWIGVAVAFTVVGGVLAGYEYAWRGSSGQDVATQKEDARLAAERRAADEKAWQEMTKRVEEEARKASEAEQRKREAEEAARKREQAQREAQSEEERKKTIPKFGGASWNYSTRAEAEQRALRDCPGTCKIAVWFRNACGALAFGAGGGWGSGWGTDHAIAEHYAIAVCKQNTTDCRVERRYCSPSGYGAIAVSTGN
jgi:tRNA A-37 threonylcarbamoyl transferase component Bud32